MEGSIDEGLGRGAAGDRVVDVAPTPTPFDVRPVDSPFGVVMTLGGESDLAAVPVLQKQLDQAMRGTAVVVIDLSGLRPIDSSGLRMLMQAERQLRGSGGQLVLVRGPRAVHRLFELTGLDSHFELRDSPSAALRTARERRTGSRRITKSERTDRRRPSSAATSEEEWRGHG